MANKKVYFFALAFLAVMSPVGFAAEPVSDAVSKLEAFNRLREGLAATLDGRKEPITEETFKKVCAPVGKALKAWGGEMGYEVRQVSSKNRNPAHAPSAGEEKIIELFSKDPSLERHVETVAGGGTRVYVRIPVVSSCLHCHGERDSRPDFIKSKYKSDKAFGFKPGDLRGLYSVFIPKK